MVDDLGCNPDKISVMRVPIDMAHCDSISTPKRDPNLLITVCRLHPIKGLDVAIDAFSKLERRYPDLRFEIIGDGVLREKLERQVSSLGLSGKIRFLGSMGNRDVLERVAGAGLFILPSVMASNGDRDGIPTSLIEAMYLRTPVVGSDLSGIPELIADGRNGFLVNSGDPDDLARRVESLLSDAELRDRFGEEARRTVLEDFYQVDCEEVLLGGWKQTLESRGSDAGAAASLSGTA
jgi:colanic acid/amylovoran biosynthesis glycosyltransferase